MRLSRSYKNALIAALSCHLALAIMLFIEPSTNKPPVLEMTNQHDQIQAEASSTPPQAEPIKAVSVDAQEVMKTMNEIKQQRAQQQAQEQARQRNLEQQAALARKQRVEEQQRLQKLKNEAEKIAIAHKKQLEEEKKRLDRMAQQKIEEEKRLAEVKKQQQQEAEKLAALKKQQDLAKKEEAKKAAELKQQQALKAQADAQRKQQEAAKQAAMDAEQNARIAGEVDRYKALIISAISRQWILPDNTQSNLSSEFRIRLAPDGSVVEVSLTRGSGDNVLDRSAQAAIYKASPLPVPTDPTAFNSFRDIRLTVRPENARG